MRKQPVSVDPGITSHAIPAMHEEQAALIAGLVLSARQRRSAE
jgi:hypothetical protein